MALNRLISYRALVVALLIVILANSLAGGEPSQVDFKFPLPAIEAGGKEAFVVSDLLMGRMLDNVANSRRQGSGFNPLCYRTYPDKPIYSIENTGLNFEHIFNGVAADKQISMFTPRRDPVVLIQKSPVEVTLHWKGGQSAWGMDSSMTYSLVGNDAIDMKFSVTPTEERFGQGYAALMWASYMASARDRRIHFYGVDGDRKGWIAFGEDREEGFETGTVSFHGVPPLPFEEGSQTLNIIEHPTKQFLKPFYYGLMDGDHDPGTTDDTLAYIMMFDQDTPIRFAMWNFVKDASGKQDSHRPAWDWQYVIRNPEIGKQYRYRARLLIRPFSSREEILTTYESWAKEMRTPSNESR